MSDHWDEPWEVIPIDRKFLYEKRFSEDDRRESLSDEDFLTLLSCRVRCLDAECDSYFVFRPLSSDSGPTNMILRAIDKPPHTAVATMMKRNTDANPPKGAR